jgi:hypothetical protein
MAAAVRLPSTGSVTVAGIGLESSASAGLESRATAKRESSSVGGHVATRVDVSESAVLIYINQLYRSGMSREALYEATRGVWRVAPPRRDRAKYAFAVAPGGVVCGVYEISKWHPAASTAYKTRDASALKTEGRAEFTGVEASNQVLEKYVGRSVAHYFNNQNPIRYVNCKPRSRSATTMNARRPRSVVDSD